MDKFTSKTYIGDNCHFNGMKVTGNGNVTIGNNFHSGGGILILTSNHNYEGKSIPYDETTIDGDVVIEDNVWLGKMLQFYKGLKLVKGLLFKLEALLYRIFHHVQLQEDIRRKYLK